MINYIYYVIHNEKRNGGPVDLDQCNQVIQVVNWNICHVSTTWTLYIITKKSIDRMFLQTRFFGLKWLCSGISCNCKHCEVLEWFTSIKNLMGFDNCFSLFVCCIEVSLVQHIFRAIKKIMIACQKVIQYILLNFIEFKIELHMFRLQPKWFYFYFDQRK